MEGKVREGIANKQQDWLYCAQEFKNILPKNCKPQMEVEGRPK